MQTGLADRVIIIGAVGAIIGANCLNLHDQVTIMFSAIESLH